MLIRIETKRNEQKDFAKFLKILFSINGFFLSRFFLCSKYLKIIKPTKFEPFSFKFLLDYLFFLFSFSFFLI